MIATGFLRRALALPVLLSLPAVLPAARSAARATAQTPPPEPEAPLDWLRIVPRDAGFYIELNDLAGIRGRFRRLGIWQTVRELAEGERFPTSRAAEDRTEALPGLSPDAAISHVLGQRSALIAASSARWRSGVVIAQMRGPREVRRLLRRWRPRRLPAEGDVRRYIIAGGIRLAVWNRLLVFGPADDRDGLWDRTVLLLAGKRGPNLRSRSDFAALRSRLRGRPDGLVYVRWPPGDPYAVAGCERLIAGLTFSDTGLHCALHGQRSASGPAPAAWDGAFVRALPSDTLFAWSGSFRSGLLEHPPPGSVLDDADSLVGMFLGMLGGLDRAGDRLLEKLGPQVTVVAGPDPTPGPDGLRLPALTAACPTREGPALVEQLDVVVGFFAKMMAAMATHRGEQPERIEIDRRRYEGVEIHAVPLGRVLSKRLELPFLARLEVCWAAAEGRVFLSSSGRHIERILRARRRAAERIEGDTRTKGILPDARADEPIVEWALLGGADLARMFKSWLGYILRHHPEAFRDAWWQRWAADRLRSRARLGVALGPDPADPRRAVVLDVEDEAHAAGLLHVGDIVVAAAGRPLDGPTPAREIARRYADRDGATSFRLGILRDGQRLDLEIPVPPVPDIHVEDLEPVRALRQLIVLLRPVKTLTISRHGTHPERFDADIVIHWAAPTTRTRR